MSESINIVQNYFDVSNASDMQAISSMMTASTTYSSENTGLYLGVDQIVAMQSAWHASFETLHWTVASMTETRPGIVLVDFSFEGKKKNGEVINIDGHEYVVIFNRKIQHIEIRNKR